MAAVNWYKLAVEMKGFSAERFGQLTEALGGRRLAASKLSTLRALGRIHPRIGDLLDELQAPWYVVRRVVHASGAAAQRQRATEELAALMARREARGETQSALARELFASLDDLRCEMLAKTRPSAQPRAHGVAL